MRPNWNDLVMLATRTGRSRDALLCAWTRYVADPQDPEQWAAFCTFVELDVLDPTWYDPRTPVPPLPPQPPPT